MVEMRQTIGHFEPDNARPRRLTTTRTFMCHVLRVDVTLDLGFHVVIGVGRLTFQQKVSNVNFISPRMRNSKHKVLFF